MAVEAARGCGFRKAGGLYLVSEGLGEPCERLPLPLDCCPTCGTGVKQSRGFTWVKPELIFGNPKIKPCALSSDKDLGARAEYLRRHCHRCVVCTPALLEAHYEPKDSVGLLWVGEKFYPTPGDWAKEAAALGASKRIAAIPKGLVVGKTAVFVAHPCAIEKKVEKPVVEGELLGKEAIEYTPGIFHMFVPRRIELIVTPSMKKEKWVNELVEKQGITLVEVPENDPDHAPNEGKKSARRRSMDRAARKSKKAEKEGDAEAEAEDGTKGDGDEEAA